jgi:hypothetical protein
MAYTLFWWHPTRGVRHETWDSSTQATTHVQSLEKFERQWMDTLTYYVYDHSYDTWWYYCPPDPVDPKTATAMQMRAKDPWQRRLPEAVPKEIRAYKLLLG